MLYVSPPPPTPTGAMTGTKPCSSSSRIGSALTVADGALVYHSINSLGTMAVDALGRIWSSGFLANGLQMYDPVSDTETTVIPGLTNANYVVTTFGVGGQGYVAYVNQANPFQAGTDQYYGFTAIPEPATLALVAAGLGMLVMIRRRQVC